LCAAGRGFGRSLLGLDRASQALGGGLAAHPVCLGILDRRGVALDADAERYTEVECLFVRQPELMSKLVDADLFRQLPECPF
jgi:hypothetical protein